MPYFSNNRNGSLIGNDVSEYQGAINFTTMKTAGTKFLYIRTVTNNPVKIDDRARINAVGARGVGIPCGGYHLIRPDLMGLNSTLSEADFFADGLYTIFGDNAKYPYGDLIPMIDVELPYPKPAEWTADQYIEYVENYINRLKQRTGFNTVLIYSAKYIADSYNNLLHSTRGAIFNQYPLALSAKDPSIYTGVNSAAASPYPNYNFDTFGGWTDWVLWQYSLDLPDVRQGAVFGTTHPDVDVDALKPGATVDVLKDAYYKPSTINSIIKGADTVPDTTNFNNLSIGGDFYLDAGDTDIKASPMLGENVEVLYATAGATKVLLKGIKGKKILVEKIQISIPDGFVPLATAQFRIETAETTPKVLITTEANRLGIGAKINTDGFSYFTEGTGMRVALTDGVDVRLVHIITTTAGKGIVTLYYRYV